MATGATRPAPASTDSTPKGATVGQSVGTAAKGARITQAVNEAQAALKATQATKDALTAAFESNNAAGVNALLKGLGKVNPTAADQALVRGVIDNAAASTAKHIVSTSVAASSNTALVTNQETVYFESQLSSGLKTALGSGATDDEIGKLVQTTVEGNNAAVETGIRLSFSGLNLAVRAFSAAAAAASLGMDIAAAARIASQPHPDVKKEGAIGAAVALDTVATVGTTTALLAGAGLVATTAGSAGAVLLTLAAPEVVIPCVVVGAVLSWWAQN
jgi:hypothetical protein